MMPPGTSTLPVIWKQAAIAWEAGSASLVMSTATPHCMVQGLLVPRMRAASTIFSSGIQVISATFEGGYSWTRSLSWSKP